MIFSIFDLKWFLYEFYCSFCYVSSMNWVFLFYRKRKKTIGICCSGHLRKNFRSFGTQTTSVSLWFWIIVWLTFLCAGLFTRIQWINKLYQWFTRWVPVIGCKFTNSKATRKLCVLTTEVEYLILYEDFVSWDQKYVPHDIQSKTFGCARWNLPLMERYCDTIDIYTSVYTSNHYTCEWNELSHTLSFTARLMLLFLCSFF